MNKAVQRLERKGIDADGHVVGTRKTTKRILEEAELAGCDAIVMAADPDRNRVAGDFVWSQEPQRVRRKAKKIPVFLVFDQKKTAPRRRVRAAGPPVQPRQLDRQLERQQVVLVEVEPGQLLDPAQPLAQRVRVDEQLARALDHAPALGQVPLERVEQRRAPPGVVVDQPSTAARIRSCGASSAAMCTRYRYAPTSA